MKNRLLTATALTLTLALGACGGGGSSSGGNSSGGGGSGSGSSDRFSVSYVVQFDEAAAAVQRAVTEFAAQGKTIQINTGTGLVVTDSHPFETLGLEYALSVGLSGLGQLIAVVDDGFLLSHDDLVNKNVVAFGQIASEDHGTGTATIAAGERNGSGIMGVANGANLHLTAFDGDPSQSSVAHLADATLDAAARGAIAQNNSWGFDLSLDEFNTTKALNPGLTNEQILSGLLGYSVSDWERYVDALGTFTQSGVVGFAHFNDETSTSASAMAALPEIFPELRGNWITAVNAVPEYDGNGNIVGAYRLSGACFETAAYCLTGDGVVFAGDASSNDAISFTNGTSFVIPQFMGSIAILAEAFPTLPSEDLVARMFASANNSFFTHTGSVDFGNGVTHGYNEEFGHGFADLKAALLPIGQTGVPATNSAYGGVIPLSSVAVVSSAAQGDALQKALAGRQMTIFDSLGADFRISAASIAGAEATDMRSALASFSSDHKNSKATSSAFSFRDGGLTEGWEGLTFANGSVEELGYGLGFIAPGETGYFEGASVLPSGPGTMAFGVTSKENGVGYGAMAYAQRTEDGLSSTGFAFTASAQAGDMGTAMFGFVANAETGSALGMTAEDPDGSSLSAASAAFTAGTELGISKGMALFANMEIGLTGADGAGLVEDFSPVTHTGFAAGVRFEEALLSDDTLTLSVRQPLRIESGSATLRLPDGRSLDGTVSYADFDVGLSPSSRQLDIGFNYDVRPDRLTRIGLAAHVSINEGHEAGNTGAGAMLSFRRAF